MAIHESNQKVKDKAISKTSMMLDIHAQMIDSITRGDSLPSIFHSLSRKLEQFWHGQVFCAVLWAARGGEFVIKSAPTLPEEIKSAIFIGKGESPDFFAGNMSHDVSWKRIGEEALPFGVKGGWSIPILIDRNMAGAFVLYHRESWLQEDKDLEILQTLAKLAAVAIQRDQRLELEGKLKEGEQKRLEREQTAQHGELASLLKRHQGLIAKFQKVNGRFVYTNGAGQLFEKLGLNLVECIGKALGEIFPEPFCSKIEPYHHQAWNGNEVCYEGELYGIHYVASFTPIFHEGQVTEVIISCNDVTELHRTSDDLSAAKEMLEAFVENSVDAIATMDIEGRIIFVNHSYSEMFGFKASEVIGKKIVDIQPDYEGELREIFQNVAAGSKVNGYETFRKRADGSLIAVSISHSPIRDKSGRITGVSGIIRDITEQKRIERELEESHQRYQSLFDSNPDLVASLDVDGRITNINPSVQKITGYSAGQAKGKSYIEFVAPSTLEKSTMALRKALKGKPQTFEGELMHKNGRKGLFHITHVPIIVKGKVVGIYVISKDITAHKKAEEYLRKNDRISAIGQLAAGIAHEIRNPLTSLKGFMQLLEEKSDEKEYFRIMLREMERLELITDEFLILAKPQAKKYSFKAISSILEGFLPLVETQANLNNVKISTTMESGLPPICCDVNQMKQVFLNVMKNAIESMPGGGEIAIDVTKKDECIQIVIEDQGCGIPPRRLKRIWEPFYSTKEKGTGLGLMIIFNIIKEHRGDIEIQSELGKGTQVRIRLPVTESQMAFQ
ncbi:PAS domain S-box protein [Bacillus sp. FJAT-27251]|uniref:PAS domain S-box protein n=1 Tax=Bacillus sp. FJAT-27251 TaxID=1684142 RepID=UPI0006A7EEE7|nr:PAS domain S-box protein [Bacillus sp. FJAT-27251]